MYALAILRYRRPLEEVLKIVDEHRAYLGALKERGLLLASGPCEPRHGGALLLRVPEGADLWQTLDSVRDGDPFIKAGLVQYEFLPWSPVIGRDDLDRL
ncbi:MAG TPA: YciI family protein [Polyangiaceae bacterium]|nr:YciI family protein [Polyangiaceae bacterium]